MRKMLVITRDVNKSDRIGALVDQIGEVLTETSTEYSIPGDSRGVETLFVDVESLLEKDKNMTGALTELCKHYPAAAIVVMAGEDQTKLAVDAVKAGAFDYLTHPIGMEELGFILE